MCTRQHQLDQQEEQAIREQRSRDIDLYGYERAFRQDSQVSYERYEYLKNNERLGGKM